MCGKVCLMGRVVLYVKVSVRFYVYSGYVVLSVKGF